MKYSARSSRTQGAALVVTLIVVVVLATVLVAFMQNTTMEKTSSRSSANYYTAQLAAESGLAMASSLMASNMNTDTFVVVANPQNQLFVGSGLGQKGGAFSYLPLFSSSPSAGTSPSPTVTAGVPKADLSGQTVSFTDVTLPGGSSTDSPNVSWVYLTGEVGGQVKTNARVAFWVEDLGGKLDLSTVGATGPDAKRPTGTNPSEIALWSLFSPGTSSDANNSVVAALVAARSNMLTPATARLVNSNVTTALLPNLAANLGIDPDERDPVPYGFDYADQGKPKSNLNDLLSGGADEVAQIISRNLPTFASSRAGGMQPQTYLNSLAASIVDYADNDSVPTELGNATGIEAVPWVNEIFDRFQWDPSNPVVFDGVVYSINVRVETYAELWNMSDKEARGDITITIDEQPRTISVNGAERSLATSEWVLTQNVTVPPNGFIVVSTTNQVSFIWGPTPPPNEAFLPFPRREEIGCKVEWNGVVVDEMPGGLMRDRAERGIARTGANANHWQGNGMAADANLKEGRCGDPRINTHTQIANGRMRHTYEAADGNTSWGGRNYLAGEASSGEFNEVKNWPDGNGVTNSPRGVKASSRTDLPTMAAARAQRYTNAVARISDTGSFTNAVELGNIFDPMQWKIDLFAGATDVTASTSPSATSGGGNSLRVGRAEHPRFAKDGTRASQLLDLFAVESTENPASAFAGRININTASTNALRALAAGVYHTSDPALVPGGKGFVIPPAAVDGFVRGVERFRQDKVFFSPSQLATIARDDSAWPESAVFGNKSLAGVTEWSDAAAEEWFAKIYALSTVRSRNFLVYAVGQAVNPNDPSQVLSEAIMVFQIYMEPDRSGGSSGPFRVRPKIVQSWVL